MNRRVFVLFISKYWPTLIISVLYAILSSLSETEFSILWVLDIDVWMNAIILELFLFQFMQVLTRRIKNEYLQTLISLIVSLLIGETIKYTFNPAQISFLTILSALMFATTLVYSSLLGVKIGIEKGGKAVRKVQQKYYEELLSLSPEQRKDFAKELDKCLQFAKNNPLAYDIIIDQNIDQINEFKKEVLSTRPTNQRQ